VPSTNSTWIRDAGKLPVFWRGTLYSIPCSEPLLRNASEDGNLRLFLTKPLGLLGLDLLTEQSEFFITSFGLGAEQTHLFIAAPRLTKLQDD
jgi:hypothetical protein